MCDKYLEMTGLVCCPRKLYPRQHRNSLTLLYSLNKDVVKPSVSHMPYAGCQGYREGQYKLMVGAGDAAQW